MRKEKINIPISRKLILEHYNPPLPNFACPQATAKIYLQNIGNLHPHVKLHPPSYHPYKTALSLHRCLLLYDNIVDLVKVDPVDMF